MFLKRKRMEYLSGWKQQKSRKALMIVGAAQTGKTTLVREFARENYEVFLELNFLIMPKARQVFENAVNAREALQLLEILCNQRIQKHQTLVLLDEIQASPQARTAIKFLVEEGSCDYIETSSMPAFRQEEIESYPVGFEEIVHLYPLDFEEFLWANSMGEQVIQSLQECYDNKSPVNPVLHETMLKWIQQYMVIGGMPSAVCAFLESQSIQSAIEEHKKIMALYQRDITHYASQKDRARMLTILENLLSQLGKENRRFFVSQVFPQQKLERLQEGFDWLS